MDFVSGVVGGAVDAVTGGVGKAVGGVLKMVTSQVDGVLSQFTQSKDLINDLVQTPIQGMLQEVEDSGMWTGPGANAFTQDLKSSFLPKAGGMLGGLADIIKKISESSNTIQQADDDSVQIVDELSDFFKSIY